MLRRVFLSLFLGLAVLSAVLWLRTPAPAEPAAAVGGRAPVADPAAVARLAEALRLPTISARYPQPAALQAFNALHALLVTSFPSTHARLERSQPLEHSLILHWPGSDPAAAPIVLLAHQDVVPADEDSEPWTHPAFAGVIADGYLWGRGSLDDKASLMAILEATEQLVTEGYRPERSIYLVFGHDEEVGGRGAQAAVAWLDARGVRPGLVLDEGLTVTDGIFPGMQRRLALIGVAEKGYLNIRLRTTAAGGHASMPPADSAIARLARALATLDQAPMPRRLDGAARGMLEAMAPDQPWPQRMLFANLWLFDGLVGAQMAASSPAGHAMLRTSLVPTLIHAGDKDNVLPQQAEALLNVRPLPGDHSSSIIEHVRRVIDDPAVELQAMDPVQEASAVSRLDSAAYRLLAAQIRRHFPDAVVAPGLMIGATDARHFAPIAEHILRFQPVPTAQADLARFHGRDERIALADYALMIAFYRGLIEAASRADAFDPGH
jgi:carboxypeptidase PM20D1